LSPTPTPSSSSSRAFGFGTTVGTNARGGDRRAEHFFARFLVGTAGARARNASERVVVAVIMFVGIGNDQTRALDCDAILSSAARDVAASIPRRRGG